MDPYGTQRLMGAGKPGSQLGQSSKPPAPISSDSISPNAPKTIGSQPGGGGVGAGAAPFVAALSAGQNGYVPEIQTSRPEDALSLPAPSLPSTMSIAPKASSQVSLPGVSPVYSAAAGQDPFAQQKRGGPFTNYVQGLEDYYNSFVSPEQMAVLQESGATDYPTRLRNILTRGQLPELIDILEAGYDPELAGQVYRSGILGTGVSDTILDLQDGGLFQPGPGAFGPDLGELIPSGVAGSPWQIAMQQLGIDPTSPTNYLLGQLQLANIAGGFWDPWSALNGAGALGAMSPLEALNSYGSFAGGVPSGGFPSTGNSFLDALQGSPLFKATGGQGGGGGIDLSQGLWGPGTTNPGYAYNNTAGGEIDLSQGVFGPSSGGVGGSPVGGGGSYLGMTFDPESGKWIDGDGRSFASGYFGLPVDDNGFLLRPDEFKPPGLGGGFPSNDQLGGFDVAQAGVNFFLRNFGPLGIFQEIAGGPPTANLGTVQDVYNMARPDAFALAGMGGQLGRQWVDLGASLGREAAGYVPDQYVRSVGEAIGQIREATPAWQSLLGMAAPEISRLTDESSRGLGLRGLPQGEIDRRVSQNVAQAGVKGRQLMDAFNAQMSATGQFGQGPATKRMMMDVAPEIYGSYIDATNRPYEQAYDLGVPLMQALSQTVSGVEQPIASMGSEMNLTDLSRALQADISQGQLFSGLAQQGLSSGASIAGSGLGAASSLLGTGLSVGGQLAAGDRDAALQRQLEALGIYGNVVAGAPAFGFNTVFGAGDMHNDIIGNLLANSFNFSQAADTRRDARNAGAAGWVTPLATILGTVGGAVAEAYGARGATQAGAQGGNAAGQAVQGAVAGKSASPAGYGLPNIGYDKGIGRQQAQIAPESFQLAPVGTVGSNMPIQVSAADRIAAAQNQGGALTGMQLGAPSGNFALPASLTGVAGLPTDTFSPYLVAALTGGGDMAGYGMGAGGSRKSALRS